VTDFLGSDIQLTRYSGVPSSVSLDLADSWGGLDLAIVAGTRGGLAGTPEPGDLGVVRGRENLGQALIVRLLTPRGSLSALGHPDFGCRLTELIGGHNNAGSRNRARLFVLQALHQEPRVAEVLGLTVAAVEGMPDRIAISFSVRPLGDEQALSMGLEVTL